jgi:hypothetical protein
MSLANMIMNKYEEKIPRLSSIPFNYLPLIPLIFSPSRTMSLTVANVRGVFLFQVPLWLGVMGVIFLIQQVRAESG